MKMLELGVALATVGLVGAIALTRDDGSSSRAAIAASTPAAAKTTDPNVDSLKRDWLAANEKCVGDADPDQATCDRRDRLADQLGRADWCYAWNDPSYSAADSEWHKCSVARPNRPPQGDPRQTAEAAAMIRPDKIVTADDLLVAYKREAYPVDYKMGVLKALMECKIMPFDQWSAFGTWWEQHRALHFGPRYLRYLSQDKYQQSIDYDQRIALQGRMAYIAKEWPTQAECDKMRSLPIAKAYGY